MSGPAPGMQFAALHGYPRALVEQVQAMLDSANRGEVPPNTVLEDICQILMAKKIVKERRVQVDEVMIDSANRGTLGVNAHNVHRNGNQVDAKGVDVQ